MAEGEQRRLAAIMFTDIVGYSALTHKNESLALELLEEHRKLLRPLFPQYGGQEIETIGDAFLVEFGSAVEATRCAIEMQNTLTQKYATASRDQQVQIRIGIHLGDIIYQDHKIYGDGVNIASRIEPLADPGGICVSEDVARQIHNKIQEPLVKIKTQQLKNIKQRVEIYKIVFSWEKQVRSDMPQLPTGLEQKRIGRAAGPPGKITSIAVLPLDNLMNDSEQEYFVDGMHEELITDLSKMGALKIISRTSVKRYKKTDKSIPEIARELSVDAVIEGSVLRAGDRVRITAQLIHGATDTHLWAESYERDLQDVLLLQSEVAQAIAREINIAITPEEQAQLASARPVNPEAYEAYLKGGFHWYRQSPEQLEIALEYFELALEKDPNYALAYTGIASTRFALAFRGVVPPRESLLKGKTAALKAMELDDTLAEAHGVLACFIYWSEWDWTGAETEFRRAIELNPKYPDAHMFYSRFLTSMRRPEEAMAEIRRALELDPFNTLFQYVDGLDLLGMRRYDDAIAQFRKTLRTEPKFPWAHRGLWLAFQKKGMHEEAFVSAKRHFALMGNSEVAEALERGYPQAGYPGAMSLAGERLAARSNERYVPATWIAELYTHAGEKEQGLEWLEKAYQEHDPLMVELFVGSSWDPIRDDPRFHDLLRRMNLEP